MARSLDELTGSYIDSRDIIERLNELDPLYSGDGDINDDEVAERNALRAIYSEGRDTFSEWEDGVTLIPARQFEDYARELADDIGAIDSNASWPLTHIDWEAAARELKYDYSSIEIDGTEYWGRS